MQAEPTEPDQSDAAADAAIAEVAPVDDAQAKIELLQAQVDALQEALEGVKSQMVKTTPSWKGAPLLEDKEDGWSFKPKGLVQYDAGYVGNPDDDPTAAYSPATSASTPARGASGSAPKAPSRAASVTSSRRTSPTHRGLRRRRPDLRAKGQAVQFHDRQPRYLERPRADDQLAIHRRSWSARHSTTRSSTPAASAFPLGVANKAGDMRFNAGIFAAHSIDSERRQ